MAPLGDRSAATETAVLPVCLPPEGDEQAAPSGGPEAGVEWPEPDGRVPDLPPFNSVHAGSAGPDSMQGGAGNDLFLSSLGADTIEGGAGFDVVDYGASPERVVMRLWHVATNGGGQAEGDRIVDAEGLLGSEHDDNLMGDWAWPGDPHHIDGRGGHDRILGGAGDDTLIGGAGNDYLAGTGNGRDRLYGGDGHDSLYGGSFDGVGAMLFGGSGNDELFGFNGDDTLSGGDGDDVLYGQRGNNRMWGGAGDDTIWGGSGSSTIHGGAGDDLITSRVPFNPWAEGDYGAQWVAEKRSGSATATTSWRRSTTTAAATMRSAAAAVATRCTAAAAGTRSSAETATTC
jgi:Ca2+-binding RTX toxin-like protein